MGCVRRVKARSQYSKAGRYYHRCVKLLREPENEEWQLFWDPVRGVPDHLKERDDDDANAEGDEEDEDEAGTSSKAGIEDAEGDGEEGDLQEIGRLVPQWTPDQNLSNFLFDLVSKSGTKGLSTMDIKAQGIGNFFRRPLEHQLSRLVDVWQLSQPLHLHHLAILRDTALTKTIAHYVHYSYANFKQLVDSGKSSWEAVEMGEKEGNKQSKEVAPVGTEPDLDEFGFPRLQTSRFHGRGDNATLLECLLAAKLDPFFITLRDPIAVKLDDGTYSLNWRAGTDLSNLTGFVSSGGLRKPHAKRTMDPEKPHRPIGRPRKYPKDEEHYESSNLVERKKRQQSLAAAARYEAQKKARQLGEKSEVKIVRRNRKRVADDAELNEEARKNSPPIASGPTMPAIQLAEPTGVSKERRLPAAPMQQALDEDTTRVRTPSDNISLTSVPSRVSVHEGPEPGVKPVRGRPRKKTTKAIEGDGENVELENHRPNAPASKGAGLTYKEQAQLLTPRLGSGIFIGQRVSRKIQKRGRRPRSRLVVIKSARLGELDWAAKEAFPPTHTIISVDAGASTSTMSSWRASSPAVAWSPMAHGAATTVM
ncbi:MAG: hypothetical protein M1830_005748, partial [Pleopsidium flavum]